MTPRTGRAGGVPPGPSRAERLRAAAIAGVSRSRAEAERGIGWQGPSNRGIGRIDRGGGDAGRQLEQVTS